MIAKLALLLVTVLVPSLQAQVLPNDAVVEGRTIGEWSTEWWKWVLTTPTNQNPLFDVDGSRANNAQPDAPVFFLAGIFLAGGSGSVTRNFTVPENKYLFFPIANIYGDNIDTVPPFTVEELRDALASLLNVTELHASIDGVPITNLFAHRAASPVFSIDFSSADNLLSYNLGHPFSGLDDPILADGYYLMVEPLTPGPHVVNFGTTFPDPQGFVLDITDHITVIAIPLSERVHELIATLEQSGLRRQYLHSLTAILRGAQKSFEQGHTKAGIDHLRSFRNRVRHQISRIDRGLAEEFREMTQQIIDRANQELAKGHNH